MSSHLNVMWHSKKTQYTEEHNHIQQNGGQIPSKLGICLIIVLFRSGPTMQFSWTKLGGLGPLQTGPS